MFTIVAAVICKWRGELFVPGWPPPGLSQPRRKLILSCLVFFPEMTNISEMSALSSPVLIPSFTLSFSHHMASAAELISADAGEAVLSPPEI